MLFGYDLEQILLPGDKAATNAIQVNLHLPDGITLKKHLLESGDVRYGLFAAREFKKGEVIWKSCIYLVHNQPDLPSEFLFNVADTADSVPVSFDTHMVLQNNFRIYFGFDCLTNHSCDPNSIDICTKVPSAHASLPHQYLYNQVALRNINTNEEITCNYLLFNKSDRKGGFICSCDANYCYKKIEGFDYLSANDQLKLKPLVDQYNKNWLHLSRSINKQSLVE